MTRIAVDTTGVKCGCRYDAVAQVTVQAIQDLHQASVTVGNLLQQTGLNHARADAHPEVSSNSAVPNDGARTPSVLSHARWCHLRPVVMSTRLPDRRRSSSM